MANKIVRFNGISPLGQSDVMSNITVTSAGLLSVANIAAGGIYTLRLWAKANGSRSAIVYIGSTAYSMPISSEWTEFRYTATAPDNSNCEIYLPTGTYYIWHPKLEHSTKVSDYTQAPEDVDESIAAAESNAITAANAYTNESLKEYSTTKEMWSEIKQTQSEITLSVNAQITETRTYALNQANDALKLAKDNTTEELKKYVTSTQYNSGIKLLSDSINSTVTKVEDLSEYVDGEFKNGITSQWQSDIDQKADSITSTVKSTYATISTVNGIATRVTKAESSIKQNADSITSTVTRLANAESSITQNADAIKLRVETSNLVSEINASSGTISMKSNRFTVDSTNFKLTADGSLTAKNATITGSITTTLGTMKTSIHDGTIECYHKDKRVMYAHIVTSSYASQYAILGSGNYDGVAIGAIYSDAIYTYYRCNIQNAYSSEGCRHRFVGDVKFTDGYFKSNIAFENNYGLFCNGKYAFRYANSNVEHSGIWVGSSGTRLCLTGSQIDAHAKILFQSDQCLGSVDINDGYYYEMVKYDSSNKAVNVGTVDRSLWLKGSNIYTNGSPISSTSDGRLKDNITDLPEKYLQLIKSIKPVSFKYVDTISSSGRTHTGFIAQQVLESMTRLGISTQDFAAFVDTQNNGKEYALRYEEFIPLLLAYINDLESQINEIRRNLS